MNTMTAAQEENLETHCSNCGKWLEGYMLRAQRILSRSEHIGDKIRLEKHLELIHDWMLKGICGDCDEEMRSN
jgi:hypothetical protein